MESKRREWDKHITIIDAERFVKILRDNIPARRRSPGRPKIIWSDLIEQAECLEEEEEEDDE